MRRLVFALAMSAVIGIAAGSFATAAELPVKAPVIRAPAAAPYNWSGFYAGADVGGGWGRHDRSLVPGGYQYSYYSRGVIGGLHAGYNWQLNAFVFGVETDINLTGITGDDGSEGGTLDQTKLKWLGSLRGRVGYAWNRILLFATGGWAYGHFQHYTDAGTGETFTADKSGWTLGGGIEYALNVNWLIRADYRYYKLGTYQNLAPANFLFPFEVANQVQTVTVGVSYKF
jgi:outer membrane immunogenic protein